MDRITLRIGRALGRHGALEGERDNQQPFDLDLKLDLDLSLASRTDELSDTVDYGVIYHRTVEIVRTHSYTLLERLAGEILTMLFEDTRVVSAEVTIAKPSLFPNGTPSVTLKRAR
jgi:dihydroneopterin aldolase